MKFLRTALMFFVISNNIFIFFYGIYSCLNASDYTEKIKHRVLFDSIKVIAYQDYEDNRYKTSSGSGTLSLSGLNAFYSYELTPQKNLYLKAGIKKNGHAITENHIFPDQ
ncbi:MAG TPA: hypothetical protein ENN55_04875 [Firmicutes bacterium]|nr:hypothetical protein [Bacillota bacterium]